MKTNNTFAANKSVFSVLTLFFALFLFTNSFQAQSITVKGVVKGKTTYETELLDGANIYLKGTKVATASNKKGAFTFPEELKIGDVLVFSYLGYVKKRVKIKKNSTFINVVLEEDDNQMLGALNSSKRFKSKRKKQ
ncbi:carboxypeptidase-like regulatory domain-containing protein [Polaribacter ponticola]|uniref:Carboxypeptidase-like regulatory domain-containing protein n=1 Tax=Polaribacter ponticola TaxID=2978475 RepID=A0ABT5S915_9FLAO|nr:carboxypeptidase-like regulatory domain-containing protein [Polaribacter sp. MSW5]MDD7914608.1 carboxypeptidase-like regulatory domain-containing protein [Polaribacter sp. MSW5]